MENRHTRNILFIFVLVMTIYAILATLYAMIIENTTFINPQTPVQNQTTVFPEYTVEDTVNYTTNRLGSLFAIVIDVIRGSMDMFGHLLNEFATPYAVEKFNNVDTDLLQSMYTRNIRRERSRLE